MHLDEIKKKILSKDIVFFDIFDTIVHRKIAPEFVKKEWSGYISRIFLSDLDAEQIYLERNRIESSLCEMNNKKGLSLEFKYIDLLIKFYYLHKTDFKVSQSEFISKATEIEDNLEINNNYLDENILEILKFLQGQNKKIYCICDMYLSKKTIIKIFKNLGIFEYFNDIFVSSEYLLTKNSGKLYAFVINLINVDANKCLMIGDNQYSDIEMANKNSIDAYQVNANKYKNYYNKFFLENTYKNTTDLCMKFLQRK